MLREYKWEDIEALRKYFGKTQDDLANDPLIAALAICTAPIVSEEHISRYEMIMGMFWEIFAKNYVRLYRVTKDIDPDDCYGLLLGYVNDMKDLQKNDRLNFSEWYVKKEETK